MSRFNLRRPSPGTVIAVVALFIALGATAGALPGINTVTSDDIVNNAVRARDIGSGQVRSTDLLDDGVRAADIRENAVGESELAPVEALHLVGTAGEPTFSNGTDNDCIWANRAAGVFTFNPASFYRDPFGVVHLAGRVFATYGAGGDAICDDIGVGDAGLDAAIFVLPPGYRPPNEVVFAVGGSTGTTDAPQIVIVARDVVSGMASLPAGTIFVAGKPAGAVIDLDGVTFRTG
jgi:hypothetical protein